MLQKFLSIIIVKWNVGIIYAWIDTSTKNYNMIFVRSVTFQDTEMPIQYKDMISFEKEMFDRI